MLISFRSYHGILTIYREDYHYHKAGVILSRITPLHLVQPNFFGEASLHEHYRQAKLTAVVDAINRIFRRGSLVFAVQGFAHSWRMRQEINLCDEVRGPPVIEEGPKGGHPST